MKLFLKLLQLLFFLKSDKTDLVGYETLIQVIRDNKIYNLEGDFVEIGTLFGGGAKKLSVFLKKFAPAKKLYVIDIFDLLFDMTKNSHGVAMSDFYVKILETFPEKTQWEIFKKITSSQKNIHVIKGDSKKITIPAKKIAFTFIDGNHDPDYVQNDFYLVWKKTSVGGIISFHDYGGDLPQITHVINHLIKIHRKQIKTFEIHNKNILFLQKIR